MKRLIYSFLTIGLIFSVFFISNPDTVDGDEGRLKKLYTKGSPYDYHYTVVKDTKTKCTVMIIEDSWNGSLTSVKLKCDGETAQ